MLEVFYFNYKISSQLITDIYFTAGVVDEDYRGIVKIVLFNHSENDFIIKRGDRIAQLICERIFYPEVQEVQVF